MRRVDGRTQPVSIRHKARHAANRPVVIFDPWAPPVSGPSPRRPRRRSVAGASSATRRVLHTSAGFVEFLGDLVASQPVGREIHVIADNLSTHKTQAVRTFLIDHPHVRIHFTPTYSSWLNQVELWFAKIERDVLARGIFTSVSDLAARIRNYTRHYNKAAKPIRWSYRNPAHRISSTSAYTGH